MGFLDDLRAKIEEIEQAAREMEAQAQGKPFQPKSQSAKGQGRGGGEKGQSRKKSHQRGDSSDPRQGQSHSNRQPVNSPECPVEEWKGGQVASSQPKREEFSLVEHLPDYLDEAFLIRELLGPPMCMRNDWD